MPPSSTGSSRRPVLFIVLGVAALGYVVSLPWQRQQWEATNKIKAENALQEARIKELQSEQQEARSAETRLQSGAADLNSRIDAVRAALSHADTTQAGKLLRQIERESFPDTSPKSPPPQDPSLSSLLAGLYQEAGWIDRAVINAERAFAADPNGIESLLRIGVIEAQVGWQKECRAHIAIARKAAPDAAEPRLALALLCDQVGALKEGEQELLAADRLRPNDEHITQLLVQNRMSQRLYAKALESVEAGLKLHPASTAFLAARAEALTELALGNPGKPDPSAIAKALDAAQTYQRIAPESKDVHFLIGRLYQGMGDEAKALQEWEIVYNSNQRNANLAISMGRLLARRGDPKRGKELLEAGEQQRAEGSEYNRLLITAGMKRNDPEPYREFARWCQKRGRLSHAIFGWDQVLKVAPKDPEALRERERAIALRGA